MRRKNQEHFKGQKSFEMFAKVAIPLILGWLIVEIIIYFS